MYVSFCVPALVMSTFYCLMRDNKVFLMANYTMMPCDLNTHMFTCAGGKLEGCVCAVCHD